MTLEVELEVELPRTLVNCGRGEAARSDVQRHVPGMVRPRGEREPDLAHDLSPHVKCFDGITPLLVSELRPSVGRCHRLSGQLSAAYHDWTTQKWDEAARIANREAEKVLSLALAI